MNQHHCITIKKHDVLYYHVLGDVKLHFDELSLLAPISAVSSWSAQQFCYRWIRNVRFTVIPVTRAVWGRRTCPKLKLKISMNHM